MSNRESEGPIQVFSNDVREINDALAQIGNRLDHLKGLRGRTTVYDRVRANDPSEDQDVLTRGSLQTIAQVTFLSAPVDIYIRMPGTSFVEWSPSLRRKYNFTGGQAGTARLCMIGWGTESGVKSIRVTNGTTALCTLTWSGSTEELRFSDPVPISINTDDSLQLLVAMSSSTESFATRWVMLELGG
jgi:hypothetical protein